MEIEIAPAREDDLEPIVALYNHYVQHSSATFEVAPVTVDERRGWFADHASGGRHRLLVARERGSAVVGWATTSPFRPRAAYATTVESSVYCHPGHVGRGVGSALYAALFRAIAEEDIERIVAGIALPNPASTALHGRFGFRPVGVFTRVGRKFGRYWDVAWYERPRHLGEDDGAPAHRAERAARAPATGPPRRGGPSPGPRAPIG